MILFPVHQSCNDGDLHLPDQLGDWNVALHAVLVGGSGHFLNKKRTKGHGYFAVALFIQNHKSTLEKEFD